MADVVEFLLAGFTNNSGQPLNGGKVYTYQAGTTTPKSVYTDNLAATPETNPVILDSNGRKKIYATGTYKFVIKDSSDTTLYTFDNLFFGEGSGTATFLGTTSGSGSTYTAAPTPALASYVDGAMFLFQADKTNSAAATLNISSLGAKTLSSIVGQIKAGFTYLVRYRSATNSFEVVNPDPGYATTQAEMSALNTAGSPIVVRQSITLSTALTLNVPLKIEKGGVIVTGSNLLTLNGSFEAGLYQCFNTTATKVIFGRGSAEKVYPQWFGATGDGSTDDTSALQAAISSVEGTPRGGTLIIPNGTYIHTGLTLTKGIQIEGGGWTTILRNSSAVNHSIYRAASADTATIGMKISDLALEHTGGGSAVDGIHLEQLANHLRLERINILGAPRDGIYISGGTASNTGNLYINLQQILSEGNGRDGLSIDGGVNAGIIMGGRLGGNTRYGLSVNDTVTGSPTSFPNGLTVIGLDLAGNAYGVSEGGHTNRYIGLRFEGNVTGDIKFETKSTSAMFFGNYFSAAPLISGTPSSRALMFDKQFFIRTYQDNGYLEYYDEAGAANRLLPKRSVYNIPLAATSAATDVINPVSKVQDPITIQSVTYIPESNITGQNTNYFRITVRVKKAGGGDSLVANYDFTLGNNGTALTAKELTLNGSEVNRVSGDILYIRKEVIGTGLASPIGGVQIEYSGR